MHRIGPPIRRSVPTTLRRSMRMIGFWASIALPLSYLPLLTVLPVTVEYVLLLLVSNVASLLLGHRYEPREDSLVAKFRDRSREVTR